MPSLRIGALDFCQPSPTLRTEQWSQGRHVRAGAYLSKGDIVIRREYPIVTGLCREHLCRRQDKLLLCSGTFVCLESEF